MIGFLLQCIFSPSRVDPLHERLVNLENAAARSEWRDATDKNKLDRLSAHRPRPAVQCQAQQPQSRD